MTALKPPGIEQALQLYSCLKEAAPAQEFINVLGNLQFAGVNLAAGEGPDALGVTKEEFDNHALACVEELWHDRTVKTKWSSDPANVPETRLLKLSEFVGQKTNAHECLGLVAPERVDKAFFAQLGTTRRQFERECGEAARTGALIAGRLSQTFGSAVALNVLEDAVKCLVSVGKLDPIRNSSYQQIGYGSKAAFDEAVAGFKSAAEAEHQHYHDHREGPCCGGGCHTSTPAPEC